MLASPPLRYIGKISYGLYVFHFFMPYVVRWAHANGYVTVTGMWDTALYSTLLAFAVAVASWHVFERPILDLKRHVDYRHPHTLSTASVV